VLQCVAVSNGIRFAVCCSVLQCVAESSSARFAVSEVVLHMWCAVVQRGAVCCSVSQFFVLSFNIRFTVSQVVFICRARWCSVLQCVTAIFSIRPALSEKVIHT